MEKKLSSLTKKEEKIFACIILHAMGDTIGYNNSIWELGIRGDIATKTNEKLYDFVSLGGINYVPQKGWKISDDTILHIAIIKILLTENNSSEKFNDIFVKQLLKIYETEFSKPELRNPGLATLNSLESLKLGTKWKDMQYDKYSGGSGSAMRTLCFGLMFNNIDKLIEFSIESSRVTHNNPIGYLGGFVSAYFVNLAINNVPINEWPFKLMEVVKSGKITKYISKTRGIEQYEISQITYFAKWDKYIKDKFDNNKKVILRKSNKNLVCRSQYYYDSFGFKESFFPGGSGDDSIIIAYDSLIDSNGIWEKLVIYSMLHSGDTDTTGCIAAGLYGAVYGFGDVNKKLINNIEGIDAIYDICKKFSSVMANNNNR